MAQGGGRGIEGARPLQEADIIRHADFPPTLFPFVDPDGNFVTSDHLAYMTPEQRDEHSDESASLVLSNVCNRPSALGYAILEKLLFKNFDRYFDWGTARFKPPYRVKGDLLISYDLKEMFQSIIRAVFSYTIGNKDEAREIMTSFNLEPAFDLKEDVIREAVLHVLYFLFVRIDGVDWESFISDCIDEEALQPSHPTEFNPDLKRALNILRFGVNSRRPFEVSLNWRTPLRWLKDPRVDFRGPRIHNDHCPVYEGNFTLIKYRDPLALSQWTPSELGRWREFPGSSVILRFRDLWRICIDYVENLELAKQGFYVYPLGALRETSPPGRTNFWYYMEEWPKDDLRTLLADAIEDDNMQELITIFKALGVFAGRMDKAGLSVDDAKSFYWRNIRRRDNGQWVLSNCRLSSSKETPRYSTRDLLFNCAITTVGRASINYARKRILDILGGNFAEGYDTETAREHVVPFTPTAPSSMSPVDLDETLEAKESEALDSAV